MKIQWKKIGLIALIWADLLVFALIGTAVSFDAPNEDYETPVENE